MAQAEERGGALYGGEMTRERRMFAQHFGVARLARAAPPAEGGSEEEGRAVAIAMDRSEIRINRRASGRRGGARERERGGQPGERALTFEQGASESLRTILVFGAIGANEAAAELE